MTDLRAVPLPATRLRVPDLVAAARAAGTVTGRAEVLGDARADLGERPLWDASADALVWVDIDGRTVHRWAGGDPLRDSLSNVPSQVGVAWPTVSGGLLLATADGLGVHDGTTLGPVTRPRDMPAGYRFNDGGCDPAGRFWVASMPRDGSPGDGTVYRVAAGASAGGDGLDVQAVHTGIGVGNGLAWSPDGGTSYLTDTAAGVVFRMSYDVASGTCGEPEVLLAFDPDGPTPDGTAVDAEGCLWLAVYGAGCVLRVSPDGTPLGVVEAPTPNVTCPGFGAPGAGRLFVTTAAAEGDPLGGAVLGCDVTVDGLPVPRFADR
ncbi:SMP-30/gluconolactonase/LRE family protein [Cellulomonas hominis]|uniref:SMP-30/gluconolactonase/LRE family protein n=1 Tax=Cellulomonas hominis TaxID=156981 RepID=UPI001B91ABEC|nr:SMP-30/gluconolactonase/LRE family protein [Cellulomonas hominis]VTR77505.1 6-deoxy-6-sulfogluconolactonase [Cellulomonas hominis]